MLSGRSSIKNRVRAVILLASVLVLLATAAALGLYEVATFKAQLERNLTTVAAIVADNSVFALALDQPSNAQDILGALKIEPDIEAGALYDKAGNLFARYPANLDSKELPTALRNSGENREFKSGALILSRGIARENKTIGYLYLRLSLRGLYAQLWRYGSIVAIVLLAASAMAFVLSTLLQRRISEPVLALTSAARTVSEKEDYSIRAPKLTNDELGTLTDAFNRMLAETQEHQGRLREQARLLDLSTDAIIVRHLDGRIVYWNSGAEQLYGWPATEALGKSKFELLKTEFVEPFESVQKKLLRDARWSGDLIQTRRDGTRIHVSTRLVLDQARGVQRVLATDTDITARKEAEELMKSEARRLDMLVEQRTAKLQETIGELEAFSYSVSHDMRAPLRAMQGYAKALLADYGPKLDEEAQMYLDRISRAANRLDLLVQDVLAYSKVAKSEITLSRIDPEKLIEELMPNHPEWQSPNAAITICRPLHPVLGHEAYLTQCVTNLLGNAVKFAQPGVQPQVRVRSELLDGKVRLWFEDNGIGIDRAHHDRIFQIFGQVHSEKKYGGTGIGLAIVRKAVLRMNGEVGLDSELGKGSRFWVTLASAGL